MTRLAEIEQRLQAATPGPWFAHYEQDGEPTIPFVSDSDDEEWDGRLLLNVDSDREDADAAFIAHAPDDIRYLLEQVRRLRGLLRYLWTQADVEARRVDGGKVRDAFDALDPLRLDIDAALEATDA